ncbi:MAG TPA: hypothetical protein VHI71_00715 [Actinomycetota bacterium]|nr:hypothetical protein [Actinomycetota bacterium]
MLRTRAKVALVAAVVAGCSSFAAAPAHASTCDPDPLGPDFSGEEQICYTAMRAFCTPFVVVMGECPFR